MDSEESALLCCSGDMGMGTGAGPGAGLHQPKVLLRQRSWAASPVPGLRNGDGQRHFERVSCRAQGEQRELCKARALAVTQRRVRGAALSLHLSPAALPEIEGSHCVPLKISLAQLRAEGPRAEQSGSAFLRVSAPLLAKDTPGPVSPGRQLTAGMASRGHSEGAAHGPAGGEPAHCQPPSPACPELPGQRELGHPIAVLSLHRRSPRAGPEPAAGRAIPREPLSSARSS